MSGPPLVRLRGASIGYDRRAVIAGVDLVVEPGEVVALLGPNGSGKSTLVRGMLGLAQILGGEVELFGQPVARLRDRWRVGYVPQRHAGADRPARPPSARWSPAAGCPGCGPGSASAAPTASTSPRPSRPSGWPAGSARSMLELSGGQQRRALIARALAAEADLLVLDEPTAGVDAASQEALADTVEHLAGGGATILLHHPRARAGRAPVHPGGRAARRADRLRRPGRPVRREHGDDHHHHERAPARPRWFGTG